VNLAIIEISDQNIMSIAKETLGLGKGDFAKKVSNIVDAHRIGAKIIGKPKDFFLTACRLTERFSEVANREDVEVRIKNWPMGPRKVKVIVLKQGGKEYPVPKGQLVDQLYPARKTVNHAPPEKKHAGAVRACMRQHVDYQLRDYRKTLKYPVICFHTEATIRRGMRLDVDHINKPFLQLCDEFISVNELTYAEVEIVGPPNLKRFKDKKLGKAWVLFHECHARLAPSLPKANRSAGSGEYQASEALYGSFAGSPDDDVNLDF
jgi:hypothetical protein